MMLKKIKSKSALIMTFFALIFLILISTAFQKKDNFPGVKKMQKNSTSDSLREYSNADGYVLEIVGLGVTLDEFRQGALWDVISKGNPYESIRNMDPRSYPWDSLDKINYSGSRASASIENALIGIPRYWGIPAFNAQVANVGKDHEDRPERPQGGIVGGRVQMHMLILSHRELSEHPDHVIEHIFQFFDKNPDVPFVILGSSDGMVERIHTKNPPLQPISGYYVPAIPDSSAVFVLARRENSNALRSFVFDDLIEPQSDVDYLNEHGVARRVWLSYLDLEKKLPTVPENPPPQFNIGRQPTADEWLSNSKKFSQNLNMYNLTKNYGKFNLLNMSDVPRIPSGWRSTPWFPVPWNSEQLSKFDKLPTLGFLHRPIYVKLTDSDGIPLKDAVSREALLYKGWKSAISGISVLKNKDVPTRIIIATGGKNSQIIDFHGMLRKFTNDGGPEYDPNVPDKFIDMDQKIGNTGASTIFMQAAVGLLASYTDGGSSAVINMRDSKEATIIFISPPTESIKREK